MDYTESKDSVMSVRTWGSLKKNMVKTAHSFGTTAGETMLWTACIYYAEQFIAMAEKYAEMKEAMRPGKERTKMADLYQHAADASAYWSKQAHVIRDCVEDYKVIEGLETYKNLLQSEVTA